MLRLRQVMCMCTQNDIRTDVVSVGAVWVHSFC